MSSPFTIGRVAKLAGVNVETIRYYQRRRLLPEPKKPHTGFRRYSVDIVKHIRFIKRSQALGFTLEEISELLWLEEARTCAATKTLAVRKLQLIDRKLTALAAMRETLEALVQQCEPDQPAKECPIIQVLEQDEFSIHTHSRK
jgi:MerR family mercuric resistance operon transcriptional regulator